MNTPKWTLIGITHSGCVALGPSSMSSGYAFETYLKDAHPGCIVYDVSETDIDEYETEMAREVYVCGA